MAGQGPARRGKGNIMRIEPYITDGAQKFLTEFAPGKDVLEFGMGGSTVWFSQSVRCLLSIEEVGSWADEVANYIESIQEKCTAIALSKVVIPNYSIIDVLHNESFDLVLIDAKNRTRCAILADRLIKPGGVLILDNSDRDRYKPIFQYYKNWELHEAKQETPDPQTGLMYPDWKTSWWIKPK